jgi:uncharacterized membrane protein YfcA
MSLGAMAIIFAAIVALAVPFSMSGLGGGATYVPVLVIAGIGIQEATTTSLFMIMLASLAATLVFGRNRTVDWRLLFAIVPFTIVGAFAGGLIASRVSTELLKVVLAAILCVGAFFMLRPAVEGHCPAFVPRWGLWKRTCGEYCYEVPMGLLIPCTLLIGFVASLIGIGGGLFLVPMLVLLFGCPARVSIGVSSSFVGLTALPGFLGHLVGGSPFDLWLALPLAAAAFAGASLGPVISLRTRVTRLKSILAIVLILLAVIMVIRIFV